MGERITIASIYGALLYLAHTLCTFIQIILEFYEYIKARLRQGRQKVATGDSEIECINETVKKLDKIPCHLLLVLGLETPSYKDLANLTEWSNASGIPFISFYDHNGLLKKTEHLLLEAIAERSGVKNNNELLSKKNRVNVLSFLDGRRGIVEFTKECVNSVKSSEVNVDLVDKCIRRRTGELPDPNLAVLCGPTCTTYGLLPWQVRLTEFVNVKTHHNMPLATFLSTLQFYGKCQQRFGK